MSRVETRSKAPAPAPVFAALGSVTRLELVSRLSDGKEYSITSLSEGFDLTRQAVTKHLQVLEQAGMINSRRVGRETRFTILPDPIQRATDYLARVSAQWDEAIMRLRETVE